MMSGFVTSCARTGLADTDVSGKKGVPQKETPSFLEEKSVPPRETPSFPWSPYVAMSGTTTTWII